MKKKKIWAYRLMVLPGMIFLIIFSYIPMVGVVIAFQDFNPGKGIWGSDWVGFDNFRTVMALPGIANILENTVFLAVSKIILGIVVPVAFAVLLNEAKHVGFKRIIQTIVYLPNFISWVILGTVFKQVFGMYGPVNHFLESLGFENVGFLTDGNIFRGLLLTTDTWKDFGFSAIIYLAAILSINPELYESADIDGATRWQKIWHVTLPGMKSIIILKTVLALGSVLNAGFDQVFNMYNYLVMDEADIIDTYVYRMGLVNAQYSISTAIGLFKSMVSAILIVLSYWLADKFSDYRVF